jgi:GNAT superfamily N-acetyltransferase
MEVEIKDVEELNVKDIPEICRCCLYWSFPEEFERTRAEQQKYRQELEAKKRQWMLQTLEEFRTCGKILYYNNVPVGYAEYGPSNRFPNIEEYPSQPIGEIEEGIVFLSRLLIVDKSLRGKGLGEKLLNSVIDDLKKRVSRL